MEHIYFSVKDIIAKSGRRHDLLFVDSLHNSKAKFKKDQFHLYGKKEVVIEGRPKQRTYVVGVIVHKGYVGLYSMGIYAFPKKFSLSAELKKMLKGKSCFHVSHLDQKLQDEIEGLIEKNIEIFADKGWI